MEQVTPPKLNLYDMANIFNVYKDDDGALFYNLMNSIHIDGEIDPILYTEIYYNDVDDWYSLSQKYYNTTYLWWTILVANKITNPFEVQPGTKIKILKANVVSQILGQL